MIRCGQIFQRLPVTRPALIKQYRIRGKLNKVDLYKVVRKMVKEATPFIPEYPKGRPFSDYNFNTILLAVSNELEKVQKEEQEVTAKSAAERRRNEAQLYCDTFRN